MTFIVEGRYIGGDWADLLADMHSWLDRRQIDTEEFDYSSLGRGVAFHVGFRGEEHAAAFAEAFGGRLQSADPHEADAPRSPSISSMSPKRVRSSRGSAPSDDPPPEGEQLSAETPQVSVSLMITQQQKADLRERGYTDKQIRDMKPEDAHRLLGLID